MAVIDMTKELKEIIGYTLSPQSCGGCAHFKQDMSTDNLGPGDRCIRNPDLKFATNPQACCSKWGDKKLFT